MLGNLEFQILNELLKGKTLITDLESRLNVTKRQLDYSIMKINEVLSRFRYDTIRRDNSGALEFDDSAIFQLIQHLKSIQYTDYNFNEDERQDMIVSIILFQEQNYVSLYDLFLELRVSRNTILKDIQNINDKYKNDGIEIKYTRSRGYFVDGDEIEVRKFMYELSRKLVQSFHGILGFNKVNHIEQDNYFELERTEYDLGTKFDDRYFEMLNILLHLTKRRINSDKFFHIERKIFVDRQIIKVVERRLKPVLLEESEIYWFSLMILSSSVVYRYDEYEYPLLKERVHDFVAIFESKSGIYISNRTGFVDRLMVHLVPVVYRMLTSFSSLETVHVDFVYDYQHLINIVSESLEPVEELIDDKFPSTEVEYITMHVAVELMRLSEEVKSKRKAALVSLTHGSMERILYLQLKQLFDDYEFIGVFSQRQFNDLDEEIDIVFTTVPLKTHVPQHIVNSILSYQDASNIVKKVYEIQVDDDINDLIDIIEETLGTEIENEQRKVILDKYKRPSFLQGNISFHKGLTEYMNIELIRFDKITTIEDAVQKSTDILTEKGYITEDYANDLRVLEQFTPNYILGPSMMIPHIDRKEGAIKEAIMVYILEEPVDYFGMKISVVCPLIIKDYTKHTLAISQLHSLAHSSEFIENLVELKDEDKAFDLFREAIVGLVLEEL